VVDDLRGLLTRLAGLDPVGLTDDDVRAAVPQLLAAVNQLGAVTAAMVASFDVRAVSDADACRSTRTWLVSFGAMSQGAASGWLRRGRLLRRFPRLAAAAGAGGVSAEQVEVVARLADAVGVERVVRFDPVLAELAAAAGPGELRRACERIYARLDPDGPAPDPAEVFERRELTLSRSGALTYLRGRLDPEAAAAVATALDALMRPPGPADLRSTPQRRADALAELARLHLTHGELPTVGGVRPQVGLLITPTMLLGGAPTGDAAGDPTREGAGTRTGGGLDGGGAGGPGRAGGGGDRSPRYGGPHCCAAGAREHPPDRSPPARPGDPLAGYGIPELPELPWMHWVHEIPPALAQRIACDAEVWRAILDPATGLPLEVGRAHRIVPAWIRKALHARDRGCRWPGCQAPAAWTDAHHLLPWWLGGPTDIDNLLLLCRYHHTKVHEGQWTLRLDPATGEVHITRPDGRPYELGPSRPFISPGRQPRAA
jgi:hypothetical protein